MRRHADLNANTTRGGFRHPNAVLPAPVGLRASGAGRRILGHGFLAVIGLIGLTLALSPPSHAAFPGRNGKITFVRGTQVWVMNPDGSGQTKVAEAYFYQPAPSFSADGKRIVFAGRHVSDTDNIDIFVVNVDGSGLTRLTSNLTGEFHPQFSPDGTKIVYDRDGEIWTMNADGSDQTKIPNVNGLTPTWSPDGTQIAWSWCCFPNFEIFVMNADGSNVREVNGNPNDTNPNSNFNPSFSPDGQQITYNGGDAVWVINIDGSNDVPLAVGGGEGPAFSPDGTKIAFGAADIEVMNTDGSHRTTLVPGPYSDSEPDWGPLAAPVATPTPTNVMPPASLMAPPMAPPSGVVADTVAPTVRGYRLSNGTFVVGRGATPLTGVAAATRHEHGTSFLYTLSEPATVQIAISRLQSGRRRASRCVAPSPVRGGARCTRVSLEGTLTRISRQGANRVAFSGRIGSRALSPGRYQATLTATDSANNAAKAKTVAFAIVEH